jgi:hypothetical protein
MELRTHIRFKHGLWCFIAILNMFIIFPNTAHAAGFGVCDLGIGVNETEEMGGIYTPIIKNCILLGVDPPPDWVPMGGRGYGIYKSQSGIQTIAGKASSLCPRVTTSDSNQCGKVFPNCMGAPGDSTNGGAQSCADTGGTPTETPGNDGVAVLQEPQDITNENVYCAFNWATGVSSNDNNISVCLGGNTNFCGFDNQGQDCFGGADGRSAGPFPKQYVKDGWDQVNGITTAYLGDGDIRRAVLGNQGTINGTFIAPEGGTITVPNYYSGGDSNYDLVLDLQPGQAFSVVGNQLILWGGGGSYYMPNPGVLSLGGKPILVSNNPVAIKRDIPDYNI